MDWLREIMQSKGVEVSDELMTDIKSALPKHFIPKAEFNSKIAEIEGLRGQLSQRDADMEALKTKAGSADGLTQQLSELQEKYTKDTNDLTEKLKKAEFDSALDVALAGSGAKNTKALRALLDMEKITFEEGKLSGFSDQLESIKAENDYLFDSEKKGAGGIRHGGGSLGSEDAIISAARSAAGLETK